MRGVLNGLLTRACGKRKVPLDTALPHALLAFSSLRRTISTAWYGLLEIYLGCSIAFCTYHCLNPGR